MSKTHGMTDFDSNPQIYPFKSILKDKSILANVEKFINDLLQGNKFDLLIVIFSEKNRAYNAFKTCCDLKFGISTQCLSIENVMKNQKAVVSNVLLKINSKLEGINFTLSKQNAL